MSIIGQNIKAVLVFLSTALASLSPAYCANERWAFEKTHCKAVFVINHDGLAPTTGWFNNVFGNIEFDPKDLKAAHVKAYIMTDSLNSGLPMRDLHLRSDDFFDVKKFPEMTFDSTEVKPVAPGKLKVIGNLKIKNITKQVTLDCQGPTGPIHDDHNLTRIGIVGKTTINRKDFGIVWNREVAKGVFMVADTADITLEIEAVKIEKMPVKK